MEQRKHWWNGNWGRLARRDVFLRADADRWHVEQRSGGAEGVSQFYEFGSEDAAYDLVRGLLAGTDAWRELSPRPPGGWSATDLPMGHPLPAEGGHRPLSSGSGRRPRSPGV